MPDEPESQSGPVILAWQDWQATLARRRAQFTVGAFDDSGSNPPPNVQDESMASVVLVVWQDWLVSRARLGMQWTPGAFDDSTQIGPPPPEGAPAHWQPPRVWRQAWPRLRGLYQNVPWDDDGPTPGPPATNEPPAGDVRLIAWQDWQAPAARRRWSFTDTAQDFNGTVEPETFLAFVVQPWFAGRVPMEQIRNLIYGGDQTALSGPEPQVEDYVGRDEIAGRTTWRPPKWSPRIRLQQIQLNMEENETGPPPLLKSFYYPTQRPRRR